MPFLSNLFGSDSSEESSFDLFNVVDGALSLDFQNESYDEQVDEDGSSETESNSGGGLCG